MPLPARDRKIKKRTGFGSHPERLFVGCLKRRSSDCYDRKIKKRTGFGSHPERTKPNLSTIFPGGMSGVLTLVAEHLASDDHVEVKVQTLRRWMLSEGLWSRARKRRGDRKGGGRGKETGGGG